MDVDNGKDEAAATAMDTEDVEKSKIEFKSG